MSLMKIIIPLLFLLRILPNPSDSSLYDKIRAVYGPEKVTLLFRVLNSSKKLHKCLLDIQFLKHCKVYNVLPKFLKFKLYSKSLMSGAFYKKWQEELLNRELHNKRENLRRFENEHDINQEEASKTFGWLHRAQINKLVDRKISTLRTSTLRTHRKKLAGLGVHNELKPCDPDSVVFNYSSICISHKLKTLLSFGLDFGLPLYKINFFKYYYSIEKLGKQLEDKPCLDFRSFIDELRYVSSKFFHEFNPHKVFSAIFTKSDIELVRRFASNKSVIVARPDKGNGIVVLDKNRYLSSMMDLVSDVSKFECISEPLKKITFRFEDKVNRILTKLKSLGTISDKNYRDLYASGCGPGILYGLPKIHKANFDVNFQMRPIFAAYSTPSYKLAKYLVPLLTPLSLSKYCITNSSSFSREICGLKFLSSNSFMASIDVESLYTNVPLVESINICVNRAFGGNSGNFAGFTVKLFRETLELALRSSFFLFDNKLYLQRDGLGMGLPLAPTIANLFLSHHEEMWLNECPPEFKPQFYRRYIDDCFVIFKCKTHLPKFLKYINGKHANLKFTSESELNNCLPFLDCQVTRLPTKLTTSVYRKPTFTGLGLSFFSFVPRNFKLNSIFTLLHRAYNISSDNFSLHREFETLTKLFFNNGFPKKLLYDSIGRFLNLKYSPSPVFLTAEKDKFYLSIPYYGQQSNKLKNELSSICAKYFYQIDLKIVFVNDFKLGTFFNYKDSLPKSMRSGVIYSYRCERCSSEYVGSTSRTLGTRVAEHLGISPRTSLPATTPKQSAVRDHVTTCGFDVSMEHFSIIDVGGKRDLTLLESIHIYKRRAPLNNTASAEPLRILCR